MDWGYNSLAYAMLKHTLSRGSTPLDRESFRRQVPNVAKAIDVPEKSLATFMERLIRDMVDDMFLE